MTKLLTAQVKYGPGRPRKGEVRPKKPPKAPYRTSEASEIDWTHTVAEPQRKFPKPTWTHAGYIPTGEKLHRSCHVPKDVMAVLYAMKAQLWKDHALLRVKTVAHEPMKPTLEILIALAVQEFAERGIPKHAKVREPRKWRTKLSPTEKVDAERQRTPQED